MHPSVPMNIDRVGIKGVKRRIVISSPLGTFSYDAVLNAYVDLPKNMRGIHMSRNFEAFVEAIEEAGRGSFSSIEEFLEDICERLLRKHGYASRAEVSMSTEFYYREDFVSPPIPEAADIVIDVAKSRDGAVRRRVSVALTGLTACPSAQQTYREVEGTPAGDTPTHMQRTRLRVSVETVGRMVRIEWLIDAGRRSFSAPVVSLLKKPDEHRLIKTALRNPMFVEDVVRQAMRNVGEALARHGLPGDTLVRVEAESFESIHPHNAYASMAATLRQLADNH